jgi:L-cysteate sulfo-lyase
MSLTEHLPRYPLAFLPTPIEPLRRLSARLASPSIQSPSHDLQLWIKRDDQTGLAGGGNKTRKLEFLIADALAQGCDSILTTGAVQSNHCRQTAAAAAKVGLACHLVLGGQPPALADGNYLLDLLLGAELHWTTRAQRSATLAALAEELRSQGHRPYSVTYGGSDPVGATGYVAALEELRDQTHAIGLNLDAIVFPSSSGGTHAGLVAGAWLLGWDVPLLGISVDEPEIDLCNNVASLASRTTAHLGHPHTFSPSDIQANADYLGGGYGVMSSLEKEAITLLARTEGILIDPVYTGRAFGGLLDLIRRDTLAAGPNVLFWHTGGTPALFAYAADLV